MEIDKHVHIIDVQVIADLKPELEKVFTPDVAKIFSDITRKIITETHCEDDWENAKVSMAFEDKRFHVASGNQNIKYLIHCKDGNIESTQVFQIDYLNEVNKVDEINKRAIGKAIVKYIGNEGADTNSEKEGLRKRLQAVIDHIQTNPSETIWKNARVTVYDLKDNEFVFISGQGKHQFVVNEEKGKITVVHNVDDTVNCLHKLCRIS